MRRIHIALAVADIPQSVADYTARLGQEPDVVVDGRYALWRTDEVNLSVNTGAGAPGTLRHLGFEDDDATTLREDTDVNGVVWEHFSATLQRQEIRDVYGA